MARTSYFQWDDDEVRFVLDQHTELDFFSASTQSADRHVAPLRHFILILSQPVFALSSELQILDTIVNFVDLGLDILVLVSIFFSSNNSIFYHL
jgi:hypothetical protein